MNDSLDLFYLNQEEPNKGCLLVLRKIILNEDSEISETKKYGMPCFCYKKKAFCYLWTDKKTTEPYLLMVEGKLLKNKGLEEGNRSRMKIFRVDPNKDIPVDKINALLNDAINLYKNGTLKA